MSGNADTTAFLGLGTNIGTAEEQYAVLRRTTGLINDIDGITVTGKSGIYRSPAWGYTEQPDFHNAVVRIETALAPSALLAALKDLEVVIGRTPTFRWGPRVIDIDILLMGSLQIAQAGLTIPHARLTERPFAWIPLLEIAPVVLLPTGEPLADACGPPEPEAQLARVSEI